MSSADEDTSLLDLPGVEEITEDISGDGIPRRNKKAKVQSEIADDNKHVKASGSGSGFVFYLDSSGVDENDDMDDYEIESSLKDSNVSSAIVSKSIKRNTSTSNLDTVHDAERLQKDLTEKYISGQISFEDYIQQLDSDEEDEDEEGEESQELTVGGDHQHQEWVNAGEKSKSRPKVKSSKKNIEDFAQDLKATTKQQLGRKLPRLGVVRGKRKRLDPTLQGLMGEANLRFAKGDQETAIKMCMEVIRQDPAAPEPFQTLSTIYDTSGEFEKSVQFAVIGAHLAPPDADEWERLANMSLELADPKQAASCLKKAIDADKTVLKYHWDRCQLLEEMGDKQKTLQGFRRLLLCLGPQHGEEYLEAAREVARLLHERGDIEAAKKAIVDAMEKFPHDVQLEHVNLVLELLITLNEHEEALELLCKRCGAKFESDLSGSEISQMNHEEQLKVFKKVNLPPNTPVDIHAKLIVVLLNLQASHLAWPLAQPLVGLQVNEYGDLMLDIAEAFMSQRLFQESVGFLKQLVENENYSKAAVWLRYGESLFEIGQLEDAETAYQKVVEFAPNHFEARKCLSTILHQLGRFDEALHTLTQDEEAELLNPTLLYERCQLLLAEGQIEDFVKKSKLLFSRHFVELRNREEVSAIASVKKLSDKRKGLNEVRALIRPDLEDIESGGPTFDAEVQAKEFVEKEFELMKKLCEVLFDQKRYPELQRITFSALGSPIFNKHTEIIKECEFLCLLSSYLNKDAYFAFNFVREIVVKDVTNQKLWNLFNAVITSSDDTRHNKFLLRLSTRHPDNVAMGILNGNNSLLSGTYKYSLSEYMNVFKLDQTNPMISLMLGITFVHMACQKFSARKHALVVQGCAFLHTYLKLRGPCQEAYYNLGRAMHQLGILAAAVHYYKKVLDIKPPLESEDFSCQKEAAFNLSLIYKNSGSMELARMVLKKHIVT